MLRSRSDLIRSSLSARGQRSKSCFWFTDSVVDPKRVGTLKRNGERAFVLVARISRLLWSLYVETERELHRRHKREFMRQAKPYMKEIPCFTNGATPRGLGVGSYVSVLDASAATLLELATTSASAWLVSISAFYIEGDARN